MYQGLTWQASLHFFSQASKFSGTLEFLGISGFSLKYEECKQKYSYLQVKFPIFSLVPEAS